MANIDRSSEDPIYDESRDKRPDESVHPNPLQIPGLLAKREADKRKEYAERAKVDVREILNDRDIAANTIRANGETTAKEDRKAPADPSLLESKD